MVKINGEDIILKTSKTWLDFKTFLDNFNSQDQKIIKAF